MKIYLLLLIGLPFIIFSQQKPESIEYIFDSQVYQKERKINVFLPKAYQEDKNSDFIVAYLFDGQFMPYFSMVSSMISFYEESQTAIPLIVVGIQTDNRWDEFISSKSKDTSEIIGADKLSLFLKNEVIPLIETNYRVKKFKLGIGHSLGGSYLLHEVFKQESIFDAVIAASPNLNLNNEEIVQKGNDYSKNYPEENKFIFTNIGDIGNMELNFKKSLLKLDEKLKGNTNDKILWHCEQLQQQNHMTTFVPAFNNGYLLLSSFLLFTEEALISIANDSTINIVKELIEKNTLKNTFLKENKQLFAYDFIEYAEILIRNTQYKSALELLSYSKSLLINETNSTKDNEKYLDRIEQLTNWVVFNSIVKKANELAFQEGNFIKSAKLFDEAFALGEKKGTHNARISAVKVYAQTGEIDKAYEHLDLLANYFLLQGSHFFTEDELCKPLRSDSRWDKMIEKLDKNLEKASKN